MLPLKSAESSATTVYITWPAPVPSSTEVAVSLEVIIGAESSKSLISSVTDLASLGFPAASVAITAKLY